MAVLIVRSVMTGSAAAAGCGVAVAGSTSAEQTAGPAPFVAAVEDRRTTRLMQMAWGVVCGCWEDVTDEPH